MRRDVVVVMSGVTVLVAGVSVRASQRGAAGTTAVAAPAGLVQTLDSSTAPAATSPTAAPAQPSVAPRRPAAAPASPTAVPRRAPAPASPRPVAHRASPTPAPRRTTAATTVVVNGAPADTQYGPVQVQIRIRAHRIIRADAIDYPQGGSRDREINSYAIPQLDQETMNAQSANIDTVSGATYTSDGYRRSLQSALDAAHQAGAW